MKKDKNSHRSSNYSGCQLSYEHPTFVMLFHWVLRRTAARHAAGCAAGHLTLLPDLGNPKTGQTGVVTLCERLSGKIAR